MTKLNNLRIIPAVAAALISLLSLSGCFTGIEGTDKIKYSTPDKAPDKLSEEELLLIPTLPRSPREWNAGKEFIITNGRIELALSPSHIAAQLQSGDTLYFQSMSSGISIAGDSVTNIIFNNSIGQQLTYQVDISISKVYNSERLPIPFTIDAEVIYKTREILKGRELWPLRAGSNGKRYNKVSVCDVIAGNSEYPISVILDSGDTIMLLIEGRNSTSRIFSNLFSLSDPRKLYPHISDENWMAICNGKVKAGMTREECRLSLGTPASVERITAYNGLIEHWSYENGVYLNFLDGILSTFRE